MAQIYAQIPDSTQIISPKKSFLPNPKLAVLYAIIPGGGQVYNRKYWKVPIVYAVMGGLVYLTVENQKEYLRYKNAYASELNGEPHEFSNLNLPTYVIKNARDETRKSMEEAYIFLTLAYVVQMAEAYVDAHLQDFDVTDDLSFHWSPQSISIPGGAIPGLSLSIPLNRPKKNFVPVLP